MNGAAVLAGLFVLYAVFAPRLERLWITAPMVFVTAGAVLGSRGLDWFRVAPNGEPTRAFTELTLAILLFADASTISLREVEGDRGIPERLLLIGLPLTMALGTVVGVLLFPGAGWATAALLAAILAPTDSALGLAVVTNPVVPVRVRRALNLESGLNDGLAAPFVTLFLALVVADEQTGHAHWGLHALGDIGLALVGAIVVGAGGARLLLWSRARGWTSRTSEQLAVLALALLAFEGAVAVGGNGLVCAFVAGILFGRASGRAFREQTEFSEAVALVLTFLVWTIFGAGFVGPVLAGGFHFTSLVYAVLSLTVVRMLPVAIALAGSGFRRDTVAFIGWFGPRGLASVVFTLLAATTLRDHGLGSGTIVEVATYTILLSVLVHGLTAMPLSARYGARTDAATADHAELDDAPEPRLRRRTLAH